MELADLASIAGDGVNGAAGSMPFTIAAPAAAIGLVFFVESLGMFATGHLLPLASLEPED